MTKEDYEHQIEELKSNLQFYQKANMDLLNFNMQLSKQLDAYYDVRRRIQMLKDLVIRRQELMRHADLRDDDELMALIETRLDQEHSFEDPNFGIKELSELIGTTQSRLVELFRRSPLYKSVDDYLDYLRLLRSMFYLQSQPSWGIGACAQEAGFSVIRTFNRKFQDALGVTPHEFRQLLEVGKKPMEEHN